MLQKIRKSSNQENHGSDIALVMAAGTGLCLMPCARMSVQHGRFYQRQRQKSPTLFTYIIAASFPGITKEIPIFVP